MRKAIVLTMVMCVSAAASGQADPCATERAKERELDEAASAPGGERFKAEHARALDASIACQRAAKAARDEARHRSDHASINAAMEKDRAETAERAAAQRSREEFRERMVADPKSPRIAFSALLCGAIRDEKTARAEIAEYRQASRIGGVINLSAIGSRQDDVMNARREQARARAELRKMRAAAIGCSDGKVAAVSQCVTMTITGVCDDEARAIASIVRGE